MGNLKYMKSLFFYVLLFFAACGVNKKPEGEIVARVGDEVLTKEMLLFLVGNQPGNADVFLRTINKWVENKLLYRAAVSLGLEKDVTLTKERDLFYENLLVSSFINIQTKEKTRTTKKEVSDYYLKNKNSFVRTDDEIVVKHFSFPSLKEAKKTKKELNKRKPKTDMQSLLNKQSVETKTIRKNEGGSNLVGFVFTGSVGDVLGPREHNKKFHVFQILQKHKKGTLIGLEMVYDEIYQRLFKEKEVLVIDAILDSLFLRSDVFVKQGTLGQ